MKKRGSEKIKQYNLLCVDVKGRKDMRGMRGEQERWKGGSGIESSTEKEGKRRKMEWKKQKNNFCEKDFFPSKVLSMKK